MNYQGSVQYSLLFFTLLVLSIFFHAFHEMRPRAKKTYLIMTLGILAFMSMFRFRTVGNDTDNYIAMFIRVSDSNIFEYISHSITEPGYLLYDWLLSRFFQNYQCTFIVSGLIIYASIYRFANKWIAAPGMFVCLFVATNSFDFFLSSQRQAISIALLLYAFDFCYERKLLPFLAIMGVAVSFHYSSIAFLLAYPLLNEKNATRKVYTFIFIASLAVALLFHRFLDAALFLFPKYKYYEGGATFDGEPRLALLVQLSIRVLLIVVSDILLCAAEKKTKNDKIMRLLSFVCACISIVSMQATALSRFGNTFSLFAIARFSNAIGHAKGNDRKIVLVASVLLFYLYGLVIVLLKTPAWFTTYPFYFCFGTSG